MTPALTVAGTGTMGEHRPPRAPQLDFRPQGFIAHITASEDTLHALRLLTESVLAIYGATQDAVETAQLVLTELVSNAVHACGEAAVLTAEVYLTDAGIAVNLTDPAPDKLPQLAPLPDHLLAEHGRGLPIVALLAPTPTVVVSPDTQTKTICALIPTGPGAPTR